MRFRILLLLLISVSSAAQDRSPAIGLWRAHLPYHSVIDVTASTQKIYAATPFSLFTVDRSDGSVERLSTVSGLSETSISAIGYVDAANKVVIGYRNSNIDVLDGSGIHNIPDLKRKNLLRDKSIFDIYANALLCYLSTALGVIVIDPVKYEIRDSWVIGNNGDFLPVFGFTITNGNYFAATNDGLKKAPVTSNAADFHNWTIIAGAGLPSGQVRSVSSLQNTVFVLVGNSIFSGDGNSFSAFYQTPDSIVSINTSNGQLLVNLRTASGTGRVDVLAPNGTISRSLGQSPLLLFPKQTIAADGAFWVADSIKGLSKWTASAEGIAPNSPAGLLSGPTLIRNQTVYAATGEGTPAGTSGISVFKNGEWSGYNVNEHALFDSTGSLNALALDPSGSTLWAGSQNGLLAINGTPQRIRNSTLLPNAFGRTVVGGLAFDIDGNLWITNDSSTATLHVRKADGQFRSFPNPFNISRATGVLVDEAGQKWMLSPGVGIIVFNDNQSIDNTGDDRWKLITTGPGQGNLPSTEVQSIVQDKNGFIWVGTKDGIGIIQCPTDIFSGCDAILPVIKEGNFANYLFKGEEVRSIAVDGANRKWLATSSGVWLIAPDGDKVLHQFTKENSPLFSNDVHHISIDGQTGEVFFSTTLGLISYRGTATEAGEGPSNVVVYPNPVPPGYNGTIGIRGLPANSIVKIMEPGGRLVYQGVSNGGQFTWTGKDYRGNTVATGTYLVMAIDARHTEKKVATIVIIGR